MAFTVASPIRQPQRFSIPHRSPLKQRVYPSVKSKEVRALTVCIGVICRENKEPRIAICVDSRLDATYSSTDTAVKIVPLAATWVALLSGDDWVMASELAAALSRAFASGAMPSTRETTLYSVKSTTKAYLKSPFCDKSKKVEIIVCGFVGTSDPMLIGTGISGGQAYTFTGTDFMTAGSGSGIANVFLSLRGANRNMSLNRAIYCAYEAKKYSENAVSVGPATIIWISRPDGTCSTSGSGNIRALEKARQRFGLRKFTTSDLPLWSDPKQYLFTESMRPDPPRPTDEPSPQPPLPESSEESGES